MEICAGACVGQTSPKFRVGEVPAVVRVWPQLRPAERRAAFAVGETAMGEVRPSSHHWNPGRETQHSHSLHHTSALGLSPLADKTEQLASRVT